MFKKKNFRESWENILETVKCEIVDKIENNNQVAYILR